MFSRTMFPERLSRTRRGTVPDSEPTMLARNLPILRRRDILLGEGLIQNLNVEHNLHVKVLPARGSTLREFVHFVRTGEELCGGLSAEVADAGRTNEHLSRPRIEQAGNDCIIVLYIAVRQLNDRPTFGLAPGVVNVVAFLEDEAQLMGDVQCPAVVESADKDCGRVNQISRGNVRAVADLVVTLVVRQQ